MHWHLPRWLSSKPEVPVQVKPEPPWHASLPSPTWELEYITAAELAEIIRTKEAGKDYIVVDVRRTDFETAFIPGALNLPAHSFYQTLPAIVNILSPVPLVIFHCVSSTKNSGRGPRTAGWYADALKERGLTGSKPVILEGGMKEWLKHYSDDPQLTTKL